MLAKCQKRNLKTYNWESLKNMSPSKIRQLRSCTYIMLGHIDKGQAFPGLQFSFLSLQTPCNCVNLC